jgi:hypothetical protein
VILDLFLMPFKPMGSIDETILQRNLRYANKALTKNYSSVFEKPRIVAGSILI